MALSLARPMPPTSRNRWAWERHYTSMVEHLMAARDGAQPLRPSEVRGAAREATFQDYRGALQEDPPPFLSMLGQPDEES